MENTERQQTLSTGLILLAVGTFILLARFVDLGAAFFTLVPGLAMIAAGIVKREVGWIIPGGIVTGVGFGISAMTLLPDEASGGFFMLGFAAGWFLIPVLSALFTEETQWWAVIPGGIIGLVGLAVMFEGAWLDTLEIVGDFWPIALIAAGVYLIGRQLLAKEPVG